MRSTAGTYRGFKASWVGKPEMRELVVYAYSWTCDWNSVFYVSWNGATEVAEWVFYDADTTTMAGGREVVAKARKRGFETTVVADRFVKYVFVEAVAKDREVLGRSRVFKTKVPPRLVSRICGPFGCPERQVWDESVDECVGQSERGEGYDGNDVGQAVLGVEEIDGRAKGRT